MSAEAAVNGIAMEKPFVFKKDDTGKSKKTGRDFRVIELHDPNTLENTSFFVRDHQTINTAGIQFKDKVIASFTMDIMYGRAELVITAIRKG